MFGFKNESSLTTLKKKKSNKKCLVFFETNAFIQMCLQMKCSSFRERSVRFLHKMKRDNNE